MSNLMEMLQDDLYETGEIENTIDNSEILSENTTFEENVSDEDESENNMVDEEVTLNTIDLRSWLEIHKENLVDTKIIDTSNITDFDNNNNVLFKNINPNLKDTILLYKNISDYKIFNLTPEKMTLFGESGFYIQGIINDMYKMKIYGTKTTVFQTMCININDKNYPIFCNKCGKTKLDDTTFLNINETKFNELINNNTNYNFEDCVIIYNPLQKITEPMTNKQEMLNWLHTKLESVNDISHAVKIDNAMKFILFM